MSTRVNLPTVAGLTIALLGLGIAAWSYWRLRPPERIVASSGLAAQAAQAAVDNGDASTPAPEPIIGVTAAEFTGRVQELSELARLVPASTRADFTQEVQDVLEIYLAGSLDRFDAYCAREQIKPGRDFPSEDMRREIWQSAAGLLKDAKISTANVVIRPRYIDGKEYQYPDEIPAVHAARFDRAEGTAEPVLRRRTVHEVIAQTEMATMSGTRFLGRLGLWLAWDPMKSRWLLVKVSIYDPPPGEFVVPPMF